MRKKLLKRSRKKSRERDKKKCAKKARELSIKCSKNKQLKKWKMKSTEDEINQVVLKQHHLSQLQECNLKINK